MSAILKTGVTSDAVSRHARHDFDYSAREKVMFCFCRAGRLNRAPRLLCSTLEGKLLFPAL